MQGSVWWGVREKQGNRRKGANEENVDVWHFEDLWREKIGTGRCLGVKIHREKRKIGKN